VNARRILLPAVLAISAMVVGCGADEDSGSPAPSQGASVTTSSLSKEEFIKRAGEACNRARQNTLPELSAYAEKHDDVPQEQMLANALREVFVPVVEQEMAAIKRLGAPSGDEEEIEAILAAQQEGIDRAKRLKRVKSAAEFPGYFDAADEKLLDYGLAGCSRRLS